MPQLPMMPTVHIRGYSPNGIPTSLCNKQSRTMLFPKKGDPDGSGKLNATCRRCIEINEENERQIG